jgi:two-component system response regulator AtoC
MQLSWRGNVRELENVLTRAVVLAPGEVLLAEHLPSLNEGANPGAPSADTQAPLPQPLPMGAIPTLAEAERELISRALASTHGHKGKTCAVLGISRPTLERKLLKYGLNWAASMDEGKDTH